jgi:hypothetical protein
MKIKGRIKRKKRPTNRGSRTWLVRENLQVHGTTIPVYHPARQDAPIDKRDNRFWLGVAGCLIFGGIACVSIVRLA